MKYAFNSAKQFRAILILLILIVILNNTFSQQSHLLNFKINKSGANDWIDIFSNASKSNLIYEADFSTLNTAEKVRLHRVTNFDKFEMEISVQALSSNNLEFGMSEYNSNNFEHKFSLSSTNFTLITPSGSLSPQAYTTSSVFKFSKCRDELNIFHNNFLLGTYSLANSGTIFETFFNPVVAESIDISVVHTVGGQCLPHEALARFAMLNTEMPTTMTAVSANVLRFYYFEKYNIETNVNDKITWEVFDQNHNLVLSGYLPNNFGSNYKTIDLLAIPSFDNYLLVVKGCNKNSTYYLRLKNVN